MSYRPYRSHPIFVHEARRLHRPPTTKLLLPIWGIGPIEPCGPEETTSTTGGSRSASTSPSITAASQTRAIRALPSLAAGAGSWIVPVARCVRRTATCWRSCTSRRRLAAKVAQAERTKSLPAIDQHAGAGSFRATRSATAEAAWSFVVALTQH
jgi:hypothetical protein